MLDESKCAHISIFVVTIIIIVTVISITIVTIFVIGARTSIVQLSVHVARVCALNGRSAYCIPIFFVVFVVFIFCIYCY